MVKQVPLFVGEERRAGHAFSQRRHERAVPDGDFQRRENDFLDLGISKTSEPPGGARRQMGQQKPQRTPLPTAEEATDLLVVLHGLYGVMDGRVAEALEELDVVGQHELWELDLGQSQGYSPGYVSESRRLVGETGGERAVRESDESGVEAHCADEPSMGGRQDPLLVEAG